ncbi:MAG: alpha-glucan family phosphorylase, partial [Gemmatimonadetes bacterium]|nr:alpha-glucan family phosphorylase [Gemmatimonadota bacterium]
MTFAEGKIPFLPDRIAGLADIALNLGWRWNRGTRSMLRAVEPRLWSHTRHNPIAMLRSIDPARLVEIAEDPRFLELYDRAIADLEHTRTSQDTWYRETFPDIGSGRVAYFCAEFGLHNSIPIYSGGLGVLAGDHCKAASDLGVPLVGVGLLYSKGYFDQKITLEGWQEDSDEPFDTTIMPLTRLTSPEGSATLATVEGWGRTIEVGAWRLRAGRCDLILLDCDLPGNEDEDRELTRKLYGGGQEYRLRQEWILGVGGVRVLRALDVEVAAFHANEGHAAFMLLERVAELTRAGTDLDSAIGEIRAHSIFTTHTPVPAGHDVFSAEQIDTVVDGRWDALGIDRETFHAFGHHPELDHGRFHMTGLAIRLSRHVNGVSRIHGEVTRGLWASLWPEREPEALPIGHVTNGVHLGSWMAHHLMELFDHQFGADWGRQVDDPAFWDRMVELDDDALWGVHMKLKYALLNYVREQSRTRWRTHQWDATHLVGSGTLLSPKPLTIGFARRFATYKRAGLLFRDVGRLQRLLTHEQRPVQLVFAGKAHPADDEAKKILQEIFRSTRDPRFGGRVAFIEDYDLHVAHRLVQGVDLWLNLPRAPLEASGTSGMKAALNGVPQMSTLDGWWAEGYTGHNGWTLPLVLGDDDVVDEADHEQVFALLERDVVPRYYRLDENGLPLDWIAMMKHAITEAGRT